MAICNSQLVLPKPVKKTDVYLGYLKYEYITCLNATYLLLRASEKLKKSIPRWYL